MGSGRLTSHPTPQPQWSQTELYKFFPAGFPVGSVSSKDPHPPQQPVPVMWEGQVCEQEQAQQARGVSQCLQVP